MQGLSILIQMMILSWPLKFLQKGQIDFHVQLYGKSIEKSIFLEHLEADA